MHLLKAFWPQRIGSQIVVLVFLAVAVTVAANYAISTNFRPPPPQFNDAGRAGEALLASAIALVAQASDIEAQQAIADAANRVDPLINLKPLGPDIEVRGRNYRSRPMDDVLRSMGPELTVTETFNEASTRDEPRTLGLVFKLPDGTRWQASIQRPSPPPRPPPIFLLGNWLILLAVFLPVALFWAARSLTGQLRTFAQAAEDFSLEGEHAPLPETGPAEIRSAAQAFNLMRQRLARLVEDRTRMLTAVGHDLRTPVTRMRLRAEFIDDADTRTGMMRDLARMDTMIDSALTFLRDGGKQGPMAVIDLASLLASLASEFSDTGADVSFAGPDNAPMLANADTLTRAVENLVHNALKYGTKVHVRLDVADPHWTYITVEDNGPGIAADQRAEMLKPFVRGDMARSAPDGGFGLGLCIAQDAALAHKGEIELLDSPLGGLCARIKLPNTQHNADELRPREIK